MKRYRFIFLSILVMLVFYLTLFTSNANADYLDNWHWRNPWPQGNSLKGAAYGNNTFVAVGEYGTILTSPDGITWTQRYSETTTHFSAVAYGNNTFVAVGVDILTSSDGITWTQREAGVNKLFYSVTYRNNTFVATGEYGTALTSTDGITWTQQNSGVNSFITSYLTNAVYGNNTFVAVATGLNQILASTDGVTWTQQNSGTTNHIHAATYGNNTFVAVGSSGVILTSPDGITWTKQNSGTTDILFSLAYGNSTFIATGGMYGKSSTTILTSPDGITWTQRDSSNIPWLFSITFGNSTFVATDLSGKIFISQDGITWSRRNLLDYHYFTGLTYGNNTFVAVDEDGTILQSDSICNSSLSLAFSLNIPVINLSSGYYRADLQYLQGSTGDAMFKVTNSGVVSNPADYSNCQVSTLVSDNGGYKLHIPEINYNNTFYSADLEYVPTTDGETWFKLTGYAPF